MGIESMGLEDMKGIDLSKAKHQLITLPIAWVAIIFLSGWLGKAWIIEALGAVEKIDHSQEHIALVEKDEQRGQQISAVGEKVDELALEIRINWAYQMINKAEADLADHKVGTEDMHTPRAQDAMRGLERKLMLANEYKNCVLQGQENCQMIQRQILQ